MRHRITGESQLQRLVMETLAECEAGGSGPESKDCEAQLCEVKGEVCHFDRLSDCLCVCIFKHLDMEVVTLLLPQVCKRWSSLARAEDLWKECHLSYDPYMSESNKKLFFRILNIAPILSGLTLELEYRDYQEIDQKWKGNCPREILSLEFIYDNMPPNIMFKLLNKYKDSVTKLTISDTYTPYDESDVKKIWSHVQKLSKLKHLIVDGAALLEHKALFLRKDAPCWKSLQILNVKDSSYEDMNTVQKLISLNLNWTEVYLGSSHPKDFRGEVKALSKCVLLDTIQVPFCKQLMLLSNCGNLDSLIIDCIKETAKEVTGVITAINKTTLFPKLSKLKMIGAEGDYVKLLQCLVKTHPEISLLNLVSCTISSKEVINVTDCVVNLEKLFLHEMDSVVVVTVIHEIMKGKLVKLKEVNVYECYCDSIDVCAKRALDQLQQHSQNIQVMTGCIVCSCKPEETPTVNYLKRKPGNDQTSKIQKKGKNQ